MTEEITPTQEEQNQLSPQKDEIEVPEELAELIEKIEGLSVAQLSKLVKILEKKWGVSSAPVLGAVPVGMVAAGQPGGEAGTGGEGKASYNIVLKGVGDKKIEVIKVVKEVTQKGLKDAKDLVDKVAGGEPQTILENVKAEEAQEIKKKLEEAGATVELQ